MVNPQQYVQPVAQQASPFLANNGNPNTVYNTAATPFGGQAVVAGPVGVPNAATAWADIAPFGGSNIRQNWSFAPASTALPASAFADESRRFWENMSVVAPAQVSLSNSGAMAGGASPFMPAPTTPVPGTGIEVPGDVSSDIHPHDPNFRPTPVGGGGTGAGYGGGDLPPLPGGGTDILHFHPNPGSLVGRDSPDWLRGMGNTLSGGWDSLKESMGFRDGSISALQVIDWFLPGDLVDANTGRINWDQAVKTGLNMLSPGLGNIIEAAVEAGMLGSQVQEWLGMKKFERSSIETQRNIDANLEQISRDTWDRLAPDLFGRLDIPLPNRDVVLRTPSISYGDGVRYDPSNMDELGALQQQQQQNPFEQPAAPTTSAPPSHGTVGAGRTTIAQGADAQKMVQNWQLAQLMGGPSAAGQTMKDVFGNQML